MDEERKKRITEIEAEERRKKRAQSWLVFYERLRGFVKLALVMTICILAFIHRVEIAKVCHSMFDRAMNHLTLSPQTRQKSVDYQNQLDEVTTNN
jgi:hypothetical protein